MALIQQLNENKHRKTSDKNMKNNERKHMKSVIKLEVEKQYNRCIACSWMKLSHTRWWRKAALGGERHRKGGVDFEGFHKDVIVLKGA